jgi:hypothetical protein
MSAMKHSKITSKLIKNREENEKEKEKEKRVKRERIKKRGSRKREG